MDPWSHSEAGRFHRVIALVLVGLGLLILLAEAARHHRPWEAGLLLAVFVLGALAVHWLARDLRRHPSGFLDPTPSHTLQLRGSRHDGR
jgi:hypothetical protein